MKTVVLANELTTADVIDSGVYEEYIRLLESDIAHYFLKDSTLKEVDCPGCGQLQAVKVYKKMGLSYRLCAGCGSQYVSPRPVLKSQDDFYEHSKACQFWREHISGLSDAQLYYIYGSRVNWISELVDEFLPDATMLLDFETKYPFLLKHIRDEQIFKQIGAYSPQLFEHIKTLSEDVLMGEALDYYEGKVSVFTAFEVVERMFNPMEVFSIASRFCQKGGLLLLTTASSTGFEYQVLGEQAPNLNPINRMNLLSIESLTNRIEEAGFKILELSTPGRLDVDIVRRAVKNKSAVNIDPFWKYIFNCREEKAWDSLQNFLQENRLSSHVRIAARKI